MTDILNTLKIKIIQLRLRIKSFSLAFAGFNLRILGIALVRSVNSSLLGSCWFRKLCFIDRKRCNFQEAISGLYGTSRVYWSAMIWVPTHQTLRERVINKVKVVNGQNQSIALGNSKNSFNKVYRQHFCL